MAILNKRAVRANISLGGLSIWTPDVISFNVNRSRKQMCATFSASVKVYYADMSTILGSNVVIRAGYEGNLKTIFTGIVEKATINPIRTDASKVMLNISGRDILSKLEGKNITRRASDTTLPLFAVVNSVIRHDVQKIEKFPTRIYDNGPKVISDMGEFPNVTVPDPFASTPGLDKNKPSDVVGSLHIEKVD